MRRPLGMLLLSLLALSPGALLGGSRVPAVASYRIEATIDRDYRLTGKETVTFTNRTSRSFDDLTLHLYLNAFRNDRSTFAQETEGPSRRRSGDETWFGYTNITRIALPDHTDLTPRLRFLAPDDGNVDDRTLVSVPLTAPVLPGATLVVEVEFAAKLPRSMSRTGWKDGYVLGAQWFPKLAAATEKGWNAHQFHQTTEFFADFGDYEVLLTLPGKLKGKVGGSGTLESEEELPTGQTRVRFLAPDVHDFAFTYSPLFELHEETFRHPDLSEVKLRLLLQPEHRSTKSRYLRAAREALSHYGSWYLPYPYPTLTIVDPVHGSETGGMEYPNLITGGTTWPSPRGVHSPESVTVHETGHQFFYLMLASNEVEEAHLDEGFNTYATFKTMKQAFGDPSLDVRFFGLPIVFSRVKLPYPLFRSERYLAWQLASRSDPVTQPSFRALNRDAVRVNAYSKTSLVLASAERTLGEETWSRVMRTYATRWAFRHPTTRDFLDVVREIAGPGALELFAQTFDSTGTIDYAVSQASSKRLEPMAGYTGDGAKMAFAPALESGEMAFEDRQFQSTVVVRRLGEASWPVEVELTFEGGRRVRREWDGKDRWIRYRATGPRLVSAVVDPDRKLLLDVDVLNNGLLVEADGRAARRWGHTLRFWAQNLVEFAALLATSIARP